MKPQAATQSVNGISQTRFSLLVINIYLCFKLGEPSQRAQAGHEAIFAAARDNKVRDSLKAFADRLARQSERAAVAVRSGDRVFIVRAAEEYPVVDPLGLDKLELSADMCSD